MSERRSRGLPPRRSGGRSGFTLAEVMVAAGILAFGVASATHLLAVTSRGLQFRDDVVSAVGLAQEKTEYLLQQPVASMSNGVDVVGRYRRSWAISNDAAVAWVSVTVGWDAGSGHDRGVAVRIARAR